ncbi:MAG TPA: 3-hydroxyacyl-ACP dehydratase FabZ [Planctomycetota bacterium]|nr:3-hydroxyacyl-ACP dehydratase FabZ [Planctomycetota bacterium]
MINIHEAIPHRPPFLLVDEVIGIDESTIRTRKKVDPQDPVFQGHFPGNPVLPGVLICEAIVQSGAILISRLPGGGTKGLVPVLTRLSNAKFKQMVRPGDVLEMEAKLTEKMAGAFFMEGSARVNGKLAVSVEFACTAVPAIPNG